MLTCKHFNILRMPKCGATFAQNAMPWMERSGKAHNGWWSLDKSLRDRPTYILVREPLSWYLSLFEYERRYGLFKWFDYFGIAKTDSFDVALERLTGVDNRTMPEGRIDGFWMDAADPIHAMKHHGMGLWSWWILRMCITEKEVQDPMQELAPVRLLWLTDQRDHDLIKLSSICDKEPLLSSDRNGTPHLSVDQMYSDRLRHLVNECDSKVLHRALSLESGITVTDT